MTDLDKNAPLDTDPALSPALIALMKGILYRDADPILWQTMLKLQARVRDYTAVIGLELMLDEAKGYAHLRQKPDDLAESPLPRLVPRRRLSYHVSLLLALLRKKLAEFDAGSGEERLILSREQIVDGIRLFLAQTANEVRLAERVQSSIEKAVEMGFLRPLRGHDDQYEVRRILKAFVDAQWLNEFDRRLAAYRESAVEAGAQEEALA
jgi:Domain of unknown function (DUF4194)